MENAYFIYILTFGNNCNRRNLFSGKDEDRSRKVEGDDKFLLRCKVSSFLYSMDRFVMLVLDAQGSILRGWGCRYPPDVGMEAVVGQKYEIRTL